MKFIIFKKLIMSFMLLFIIALTVFSHYPNINVRALSLKNEDESSEKGVETVFSYKDVFKSYYNDVLKAAEEKGIDEICTFEDFCEQYYEADLEIDDYTQAVINCLEQGEDIDTLTQGNVSPQSISSSGDADYILGKTYYSATPKDVFKRPPTYGGCKFYTFLKNGDIIVENKENPLFDFLLKNDVGHAALITNMEKMSWYGMYIETIEAVGGGVQYGFLDDTRMLEYKCEIYRIIEVTTSIINSAISYAKSQIGKNWSPDVEEPDTYPQNNSWYCSELVYGAYINAGIEDLDWDDQVTDLGWGVYGRCLPIHIRTSANTTQRLSYTHRIVDLKIIKKSDSNWTIRVTNTYQDNTLTVYYNTKMCFENDAKLWKNLNHVTSTSLIPGQSKDVIISENWFATHTAFSIIYGTSVQIRVTLYANELNNSNKTMSINYYALKA